MFWILALFVASGEKMGLCLLILVHYKESMEVHEILSVVYHCQKNLCKSIYSSGYKLVAEYIQGIPSRPAKPAVILCRFLQGP